MHKFAKMMTATVFFLVLFADTAGADPGWGLAH